MSETGTQSGTQSAATVDSGTQSGTTVLDTAMPSDRSWLPEAYRAEPSFQNFKGVDDLAASYKSAASMVGMDKGRVAVIPKDDADADGWAQVYDKLGRPKAPSEYGIKAEGPGAPVWEAATKVFHDAGLNTKQAAALHGFVQQIEQGQAQMFAERPADALAMVMPRVAMALTSEAFADRTLGQLKTEWGGAFDERMHAANRAVSMLGQGDKDIAALFAAPDKGGLGLVNLPGVVKLMAAIGARIAEPAGLAGASGSMPMGRMSPTEAANEISRLTADSAFRQKLMGGDGEAMARWKAANDALSGA